MECVEKNKQGTFIHGIAASEHIDSSGERIKIEGVDISRLTTEGTFNYEHESKAPSSIVGKIFEAKKILKASDCENDNHRYFWNKIQMPFLYVAGELFDGVGHKEAENVASMVRYDGQTKKNEESRKLINFSIEGSRLEKRGSTILKCIAKKISITITPCNKVCEAEEMKPNTKEAAKAFTGDFSFVQDVMMEKGEPTSSCQLLKSEDIDKTNWGEMGFVNTNIKSEDKVEKNIASKVSRRAKEKVQRYKRKQRVRRTPSRSAPIKPPQKRQPRADRHVIADEKGTVSKSKDAQVKIPAKEMVEEHKKLVNVLESPSHKDDKKEAKKQRKELKEYKQKLKKKQGVPKGADPAVHERCVQDLKDQGKDKSSAYAICNASKAGQKKRKKKLGKYESNVRKALTASCGMAGPSTKVQGDAIAKADIYDFKSKRLAQKDPNVADIKPTAPKGELKPARNIKPNKLQSTIENKSIPEEMAKDAVMHHLGLMHHHQGTANVARMKHQRGGVDVEALQIGDPDFRLKQAEQHDKLAQQHIDAAAKYHKHIPGAVGLDDIINQYKAQASPKFSGAPDKFIPFEQKITKSDIRNELIKSSNQIFDNFNRKQELIEFLNRKLPKLNKNEILAIAKAVTYVRHKKQELKLASLLKADIYDFKSKKLTQKDPNVADIKPTAPKGNLSAMARPEPKKLNTPKTKINRSPEKPLPQKTAAPEQIPQKQIGVIRYGTPSGNLWMANVTHENGTKTQAVHPDKKTAVQMATEGKSHGEYGAGDWLPEAGKPNANKPNLIVGANNYLRQKVPFFLLQQHDLYLFQKPRKNPEDPHEVGLIAASRLSDTTPPHYVRAQGKDIHEATDNAIRKMLIHARPSNWRAGQSNKKSKKQQDMERKKNIWLYNRIYEHPKVSLASLLPKEPKKTGNE